MPFPFLLCQLIFKFVYHLLVQLYFWYNALQILRLHVFDVIIFIVVEFHEWSILLIDVFIIHFFFVSIFYCLNYLRHTPDSFLMF